MQAATIQAPAIAICIRFGSSLPNFFIYFRIIKQKPLNLSLAGLKLNTAWKVRVVGTLSVTKKHETDSNT